MTQQNRQRPAPTFRKVSSAEYVKISRGARARAKGALDGLLNRLGYSPTPPPKPKFGLGAISPSRAALGGTGLGVLAGLGGVAAANPAETAALLEAAQNATAGGIGSAVDAVGRGGSALGSAVMNNPISDAIASAASGVDNLSREEAMDQAFDEWNANRGPFAAGTPSLDSMGIGLGGLTAAPKEFGRSGPTQTGTTF